MIPEKWLRLQFGRQMTRGFVVNAELAPQPTLALSSLAEAGESFVVKITAKTGAEYWMTDRKVFVREGSAFSLLFRYEDVRRVHWMYKDFMTNAMKTSDPEAEIVKTKLAHFDRLEVEIVDGRQVVLEGLDQAYLPVFEFLKLLYRAEKPA